MASEVPKGYLREYLREYLKASGAGYGVAKVQKSITGFLVSVLMLWAQQYGAVPCCLRSVSTPYDPLARERRRRAPL